MIRKSVKRFSEKIMLNQRIKARRRLIQISLRFRNLFLVRLLAADGLELGEDGIDVEVVALFFRRLILRLLAGGFGGRQQRRATMADVGRLLLGRALHLEVEFDL